MDNVRFESVSDKSGPLPLPRSAVGSGGAAKIFLAEQRGVSAGQGYGHYHTLRFGDFAHPHKGPVGALVGFSETHLAPGGAAALVSPAAGWVLVLPLAGAVLVKPAGEAAPPAEAGEPPVEAGELLLLPVAAGQALSFQNPDDTFGGSFLHLWVAASVPPGARPIRQAFDETTSLTGGLLTLTAPDASPAGRRSWPVRLRLGRLAARQQVAFAPANPGSLLFVSALAGAFEVAGRLLHPHDSLALWPPQTACEAEALSPDALLLVAEVRAQA